MASWVGRNLGRVSVELLLARGGTADVYLGQHSRLHRAVAIKVLNSQFSDDPDLLERFQREARVIAMLRHPNIVQVLDFDSVDGHPYLVMEYVPGLSLANYLRAVHGSGHQIERSRISRLLGPVASALDYAHERGVIHRDVKPANILLTSPTQPVDGGTRLPEDVQPVLTDFGLVRFLHSAQQSTAGRIAGTPAYMSPEQAAGEATDGRTDVYSLAVVLYELLAGRVPFEADTTMALLQKQISEPPAPIPDLSAVIQSVVQRGLAKRPEERFQRPVDLAAAFQTAVDTSAQEQTFVPRGEAPLSAAAVSTRTRPVWNWLATGIVAAAVVLIAGFLGIRSLVAPQPAAGAYPTADASSPQTVPPALPSAAPIGVLRFQDGSALVDKVSFNATGMPAAPAGGQYEVWLVADDGEELRSVGYLNLDAEGEGTVSFVDPQGNSLLSRYAKTVITVEPQPDPSPNPTDRIAFSAELPADGLIHVRHLLVGFPKTPNGTALIVGLLKDSALIDDAAHRMLDAYQNGDATQVRAEAEGIVNSVVGIQSEDHKDWDQDGRLKDPSDGYGMLLNGENAGYIQGSLSHAGYAAETPDATVNMKLHGGHVTICMQNLQGWTPQLRDLAQQIAASPATLDVGPAVRQAVALADDILKGTDLNGNERVEPIVGEGGAQTAYQHAFYMADLVIAPGN